jgi:carbon storage regulator
MGHLEFERRIGDKIYIGDDIAITIVDIYRGKVRLGFEAPREVRIYRAELLVNGQPREHRTLPAVVESSAHASA